MLNRTVDGPGYTGHVMDAATGLVYAQQRYYDPLIGRFLSIDPVAADPGTGGNFNRYWYANNNPYRFTDPDGRDPEFSGFGTNFKPGPGCNETATCVSLEQADESVASDAKTLVGGAAATVGAGAVVAIVAPPAVVRAATSTAGRKLAKQILCGVLSCKGDGLPRESGPAGLPAPRSEPEGQLADDLIRKAEIVAKLLEKLTKNRGEQRPKFNSGGAGGGAKVEGIAVVEVTGRVDSFRIRQMKKESEVKK